MQIKWTKGNRKLQKTGTIGFGIPAFKAQGGFVTCPQAGACAAICYARQGSYTWPATIKAREHNLALVRGRLAPFIEQAVKDLRRMRPKSVRIHDSGDFFNQKYYYAWQIIAKQLPGIVFYAYTKSLHLDMTQAPSNLRLTQSQGGKLDSQLNKRLPHSRIFATVADRKRAGYVDGNKNDLPAMKGERRIGLVYHGAKNLTPQQEKAFA